MVCIVSVHPCRYVCVCIRCILGISWVEVFGLGLGDEDGPVEVLQGSEGVRRDRVALRGAALEEQVSAVVQAACQLDSEQGSHR